MEAALEQESAIVAQEGELSETIASESPTIKSEVDSIQSQKDHLNLNQQIIGEISSQEAAGLDGKQETAAAEANENKSEESVKNDNAGDVPAKKSQPLVKKSGIPQPKFSGAPGKKAQTASSAQPRTLNKSFSVGNVGEVVRGPKKATGPIGKTASVPASTRTAPAKNKDAPPTARKTLARAVSTGNVRKDLESVSTEPPTKQAPAKQIPVKPAKSAPPAKTKPQIPSLSFGVGATQTKQTDAATKEKMKKAQTPRDTTSRAKAASNKDEMIPKIMRSNSSEDIAKLTQGSNATEKPLFQKRPIAAKKAGGPAIGKAASAPPTKGSKTPRGAKTPRDKVTTGNKTPREKTAATTETKATTDKAENPTQPESEKSKPSAAPSKSAVPAKSAPKGRKAPTKNLRQNIAKIAKKPTDEVEATGESTTAYLRDALGGHGLIAAVAGKNNLKTSEDTDNANLRAKSQVFVAAAEVSLKTAETANQPRLIRVKGRRRMTVREMGVSIMFLNSDDSFVLVDPSGGNTVIYIFYGKTSNRMERSKALDIARRINVKECGSRATIYPIDQKEGLDEPRPLFWKLLDGSADQIAATSGLTDDQAEHFHGHSHQDKLYKVGKDSGGKFVLQAIQADKLGQELLVSKHCLVLNCVDENTYLWVGKQSPQNERKHATEEAKNLFDRCKKPEWARLQREPEGAESVLFKEKFWNFKDELPIMKKGLSSSNIAATSDEVFDIKTLYKPLEYKETVIDDTKGNLKVFRIHSNARVEYPKEEYGRFYTQDAYILHYVFKVKEKLYESSQDTEKRKDKHLLYFWQGRLSNIKKKGWSALLTIDLDDSINGETQQMRIPQQRETEHFLSLFGNTITILKGSFEPTAAVKTGPSLYQVRKHVHFDYNDPAVEQKKLYTRVIEVDPVVRSLNSNDMFILKSDSKLYGWFGQYNTFDQSAEFVRNAAKSVIKSDEEVVLIKEGEEPAAFWDALGGQGDYYKIHHTANSRLFHCGVGTGSFKIEELPTLSQEELIEKDMMMLDAIDAVYAWKGSRTGAHKEKLALEAALEYVKNSPTDRSAIPVYLIESGEESYAFTSCFHGWDYSKTKLQMDDTKLPLASVMLKELKEAAAMTYSIEELRAEVKPKGVDPQNLHRSLSDDDFKMHFKVTKQAFEGLPKWKQELLKKDLKLF